MKNGSLINRINDAISKYTEINTDFCDFWRLLVEQGDFYIVGGAIRSIYKNRKPRDIDIIVKNNLEQILLTLKSSITTSKNSLGGYKIDFGGIIVDIWDFENHWAFKTGILNPDEKNLAESCFYNFDALIYSPSNDYLDIDLFKNSIESNTIDFIKNDDRYISSNPGKLTNVLRAIVAAKDFNLKFSSAVTSYIRSFLECNDFSSLKKCERRHYQEEKISYDQFNSLLQTIS